MATLRIGSGITRPGGRAAWTGGNAVPDGDLLRADEDVLDEQPQDTPTVFDGGGGGVDAVIARSRSFAAIGQWTADAGPEVLAVLGAARGPAEESTLRRAFALVSADSLDRVLGAWLHTRAVQAGGRPVIAVDGKTVRGAKSRSGKAPHLVAAPAHGIGAVLG
jgi:hypothetical protein